MPGFSVVTSAGAFAQLDSIISAASSMTVIFNKLFFIRTPHKRARRIKHPARVLIILFFVCRFGFFFGGSFRLLGGSFGLFGRLFFLGFFGGRFRLEKLAYGKIYFLLVVVDAGDLDFFLFAHADDVFGFFDALRHLGRGMSEMSQTMIVALLAFGLMESVRERGGLAWIVDRMSRVARGPRTCELAIFLLVSLLNVFTANNTLAVLLSGPMASDCADRFRIGRARLASLIDTASCIVQGFLPYGGQILIAVGLGRAAGLDLASGDVICALYYPPVLAAAVFVSMFIRRRGN